MAKEELECSFCGRKKPETSLLIAGLDAHICDRCIEQAHGIVIEESKQSDNSELSAELMLRKPVNGFEVVVIEVPSREVNAQILKEITQRVSSAVRIGINLA